MVWNEKVKQYNFKMTFNNTTWTDDPLNSANFKSCNSANSFAMKTYIWLGMAGSNKEYFNLTVIVQVFLPHVEQLPTQGENKINMVFDHSLGQLATVTHSPILNY